MSIQQPMCANCGKPLSPYWRTRCEHCKAPIAVARGFGQVTPQYAGFVPQAPPQYPIAPPAVDEPMTSATWGIPAAERTLRLQLY